VVEGADGAVEIRPAETPEPGEPTVEPAQPGQPTATPVPGGETSATGPGGGLCPGAAVMGALALAVTALWQRMRG